MTPTGFLVKKYIKYSYAEPISNFYLMDSVYETVFFCVDISDNVMCECKSSLFITVHTVSVFVTFEIQCFYLFFCKKCCH